MLITILLSCYNNREMKDFFMPQNIYEIVSFLSSVSVIIITGYTFYLTNFSNKILITGKSNGSIMGKGYNVSLAIKNNTLHDISILEIGILYKDKNNKYWNIELSRFKKIPFIVKPFEVSVFTSPYYQKIQTNEEIEKIDLYNNENIYYFYNGDKIIFISKKRKSQCQKIYKTSKENIGVVIS